jgi:glycosyltransferase involved in cell wall biosynthesis
MPNVLIVSIDYWPEETGIGPYSTGLAEYLARSGHEVTVVAGMPHYPQWEVAPAYRGHRRLEESRNGVRILRRHHYVPRRQSAIRRAAYEATWLIHAGVIRAVPTPDIVLGVVPSLSGGMIARIAAARARAAYGVIVQDLVSAAATQSGIPGGRAVAALTLRAESWALQRATVVAPVADAFRPSLAAIGVPPDRIAVLPNWSHLPESVANRDEMRRRLGWRPDEWVVLHSGNMGLKQGLDQVLEAGRMADRQNLPIRFVLMGDGNQREALVDRSRDVGRLEFRAFVPESELADVLGAADVLLLSERASVVDMSLPSKLTAYFAAGRPVVAAVNDDGASAQEVRRAGAGVTTPAGDPASLLRAIMSVRDRSDRGSAFGDAGRRYAQTSLSEGATFERLDAIVERILDRTRARRKMSTGG